MSHAQLLLRSLLEQAGGASESGFMLVIDGEGLEDLPEQMATSKGSYAVHRVHTELGLRHLLWKAKGAPLIAVMPEAVAQRIQKSPDLLRRARAQRVHALTVNDVLEAVLGVRVVGADSPYMQQLAMEHVDRLGAAISRRTLPTVVDRRLLTELLVDISVGEHVRTKTPAQLLALWVQAPPEWLPKVSQLVRDALPAMHGDEGRLLAWALLEPEKSLQALVVHGAVLTVELGDVPEAAFGPLYKAAAEPPLLLDYRVLRRAASRLAEDTLTALGDSAAALRLLSEADKVARKHFTVKQVETSRVLPLAFLDRCESLAKRAAEGKAVSAADIAWLSSHRAARMHGSVLPMMEAMARLSRYLDRPLSLKADMLEQVRAYQREGAFVDLAMLHLRRAMSGNTLHHAEAKRVLELCRERRDRENRRFADTLSAEGYEKALHNEGISPLHRIWKRNICRLWEKEPDMRLFLVVLDGCSYAVFLELLYALSQDSSFPLGIRPDEEGRVCGIAALAPLPTVTSHARGAIFLGELPQDPLVAEAVLQDVDEAKSDKARFGQNKALGSRSRRLFLKGDLGDGGQGLFSALQDESLDVVAAVFNAVDDQIGSANTGASVRLLPEDITAFKPALRMALSARRRVLLTADHGHSPYVDKSLRVGSGKTPRFFVLGKGETAPEGFVEIDVGALDGPPVRRAFAWRSGVYLGMPQVGFHGGCGLEEMVVPLAWIERDGLAADEPDFWYGRGVLAQKSVELLPGPDLVVPPIVTPLPSDELKPKPVAQLSLFNPADKAGTLPLPAALIERLSVEEKTVLVLLRENGSARASELGERIKKNPSRFNGWMVQLRKKLHAEGHVLFVNEVLPTGELLYRYEAKEKA